MLKIIGSGLQKSFPFLKKGVQKEQDVKGAS